MGIVVFTKYEPIKPRILALIINLKPISKKNKYRLARNRMYKDPDVVNYEKKVRNSYIRNKLPNMMLFEHDVSVAGKVFFSERRGDLDNALQTTFDALQGLVYNNDAQIKRIDYAEKFLDPKHPRIELIFTEIS